MLACVPFPAAKYPKELRLEVGRLGLELPMAEVRRRLAAGRVGDWGRVEMPYSTVVHYATVERKRRQLEEAELLRAQGEAVEVRADRLAREVLDLAEGRLEKWRASDKFSPRDLVDVADLLNKLGRVASGRPAAKVADAPRDPLSRALLGEDGAVAETLPT